MVKNELCIFESDCEKRGIRIISEIGEQTSDGSAGNFRTHLGTSLGPSGNAFTSKAGGPGIEPTVRLSLSPSRSSRVDAGAILVGVSISHPY